MLKKLKNVFFAIVAFSCFALTFIACPQPTSTGGGTQASLSLSESSITFTTVGETKQIKATYTGSDKLSWSVEDTSIATLEVAEDALSATVKAIKAGSTNLSVKEANGSLSASLKITNSINAEPVSDLTVTATDATSVTISWTAPENYENFTVKAFSVSTSQEGEESESEITLENGTTSETSFTISNLSSNSKYKFYVYTNYGGVQSSSQSVEATTSSISIDLALDGSDFESPTEANATITLLATVKDSSGNPSKLSITQWTSSDSKIATVEADETNANKATVTAVGPSGTANITATIKDGETELASKSYSVSIVGAAVDVSSVAITVQSSASDESLSDKQVKVSWNAPSYVDSYKVELYKQNETTADVSKDSITDTSVILKVSDYGTYFAKVYSVYGEDVSNGSQSQTAQVKDFLPCDEVEKIELDLSTETPSLSWTAPGTSSSSGSESSANNSDFAGVNIYLDDKDAVNVTESSSYSNSSLSGVKKIKITTLDTSNNESSGKTFTIYSSPSFENISVETGYTGQLVISNVDFDSSANSSITWSATSSINSSAVILDTENSKLFVNGLTVGTAVSPSITFTAKSEDCSVKYAALSTNKSVSPVMTVWKLKSWWPKDLPPAILPHISDSVTAGNIVMANFAGASQTSDMMYADATYTAFIVHPGLTNTDGTSISLEATNSKGESSGLYVYADIKGDVSWQSSYSNKTNWNYTYSSKPQLYTVSKDSMTDTQKSEAVFYKVSSTSDFANNAENAVPAGYEGWFNIKSAVNNAYWYGSCFNVSLNSEIASNGDSDVAILSQTWSGYESSDNPTEITDFTPTVDTHSITLNWTDPSDVDFAYLEISSEGKLLDGTTAIETQKINAGTQTATFSKLSAATSYTFTVKEYDAFANTTETSTSATTSEDKTAPSDVSGLTANSGRNNVKLSWTNPSDVDAKTISIYQGDSTTAVETISIDNVSSSAENQSSVNIKNLSAGTEYTFTVKAVDYAGNESKGVTVKATPTTPSASNVEVEPKYTGSILVTWTDTTASETDSSGEAITYSYKVSLLGSSTKEMTVESGVEQAHFTGLTIGDTYTGATVQCIPSDDSSAGDTVSVEKNMTVSKVLWKIACDEYDNTNRLYRILPAIYTGSTYTTSNHIIVEFDGIESGISANNEWQYLTYGVWEVVPALADSSDGTKFSLMASTKDGVETGLYLYGDKERSISSGTYYSNHWGSNANLSATSSYPVLFFVAPAESSGEYIDTNNADDLSSATFSLSNASTSITDLMKNNSYGSQMYYIYTTMNNTDYYWADIHTLCEGTTNSNLKTSFAICETTLEEDTLAGAPSEVSNLNYDSDSLTATSVSLTWTNPSEADFDHVLITYGDESITATGTSKTIIGLSPSTSYNFTVKTVDMMGNTSDGTLVSATTAAGTNYPTNIVATVGWTGQIVVTWDDSNIYDNYTYTVSATSSGTDTVSPQTDIAQGTQKAVFNGLTVGNTYTFTVKATYNNTDYEATTKPYAIASQVVVYIKSATKNSQCGGATKYLVNSYGNTMGGGAGIGCYIPGTTDDAYIKAVETKWIVMPGLSNPADTNCVSFASYATSGKYLQISTLTVDTSASAGTITSTTIGVSGEPFDWGYGHGAPTSYPLLLVDKPTTDDGMKYASFIKSDADNDGSFSLALAYEIESGTTYYLAGHTFRAAAETSTTINNTSTSWNSEWYHYKWSFVTAN